MTGTLHCQEHTWGLQHDKCTHTHSAVCPEVFCENPSHRRALISATDLFLFSEFKISLKGYSFESVEEIKKEH
jgi:hypothetical protein